MIGLGCLNANIPGMKTFIAGVLRAGPRRCVRSSIISVVLMLIFTSAMAQSNGKRSEGTLAVTATVVASTTMIVEADGQPRLMIVNATDPRDNVSRFMPIANRTTTPTNQQKLPKSGHHHKQVH